MGASIEVAHRFAANLRRARRNAGLSQEALGDAAGMHRTAIGLLERGARVPRIDTLLKLAVALGVPLECSLLEGIDWQPGSVQLGGFALVPRDASRGLDSAE